ncbi:hypothetical protein [Malaciobacter canalis]|uniref:hypothetical protein n=1 Tax=Malaciobacter canalis TaxID=1912871 RepID=UPI00384DF7A5
MTSITINGKVLTILEKEYEDKKTVYAQFLMESESKGMEVLKVKVTNNEDISKLQKDMIVSVPVLISAINGNMYYSQVEAIKYLKEMK